MRERRCGRLYRDATADLRQALARLRPRRFATRFSPPEPFAATVPGETLTTQQALIMHRLPKTKD